MIKIYLVGVSDVGKSAVGGLLAGELDLVFYDLDQEIKKDITFFNKFNNRADYEFSIEGLKLENIPKCLIEFLESKNEEFKRYVTCAKGQHKKLDIFKIARQN